MRHRRTVSDSLRSAGSAARTIFNDVLNATAPPLPSIPGLTEELGTITAITDPAIGHVLWRFFAVVPAAPMALAAATHLAGGHGAVVTLSGLQWGVGQIMLTVRVFAGSDQLAEIMEIAGFTSVWSTDFEEWVYAA